ncbi:MAG: hypothetical protein AAF184_11545 [Pseudomonadota bacterium]
MQASLLVAFVLLAGVALAGHSAEHALGDELTHHDCALCEHLESAGDAAPAPAWFSPHPTGQHVTIPNARVVRVSSDDRRFQQARAPPLTRLR